MKRTPEEGPTVAATSESVSDLMRSLPTRLSPGASRGWKATFHFRLSRCPNSEWTVRVEDDAARVDEGLTGVPDCVVEMSAGTLIGIATGTLNPQVAFMLRRVKVSHLGQMMKFIDVFRSARGTMEAARHTGAFDPESLPLAPPQGLSLPLAGVIVLDCSRMLPGAVLARHLLELGARVIKVEDAGGDPLRHAPPMANGIGAGFVAFYRGAQSVELNLRTPDGTAGLRSLARRADVLVESFRPGTMARWGLGLEQLRAANPALVTCSLSGYGGGDDRPGHDLNFIAGSGLLSLLGDGLPGVLLADVAAGMLAATGILAALLARRADGRGTHVEQPLAAALRPFVAWQAADRAAGGDGIVATHLSGACPAYRRYRCGDGRELVVAAVEPKFWTAWVEVLDLPHLAGVGLDPGDDGARAAAEVAAALAHAPRDHWLALASNAGVPVSAVLTLAEAVAAPAPPDAAAPLLASLGVRPAAPAPGLGEHTAAVLAELAGTTPA